MKFFFDDAMLRHEPAGPERPDRLVAIHEALRGARDGVTFHGAASFDRRSVERVHDATHVDDMLAMEGRTVRVDADTEASPGTVDALRAAVGCSLAAARAVAGGEPAWALVRPPGHHAGVRSAAGFCFLDNIAIAAEELLDVGFERVLIVDWDVHHGNGTQEIFFERGDVFYFSTHQWPLYPGTGAADEIGARDGEGATLNVPMPPGCDDDDYVEVYESVLRRAATRFAPDAILVSAGFDAHARDPLAGMQMTARGFGRLARIVGDLASELCDGHLGLFLEGGYDLRALAESVVEAVDVLEQHR